MKKAIRGAALFAALALVVSCATAPKPVEQPVEQPKPTAAGALPEAELARAKALKQQADAYSLGDYDTAEYAAAEKDFAAGQDAYNKDNTASKAALDKAIAGYTAVIAKGGALYLSGLQAKMDAARKDADSAKAGVAVKDDYDKAVVVADRAVKEKNALDIASAAADFPQATDMFTAAAASARDKKAAADAAMKAASESEANAKNTAVTADSTLKTEGFADQTQGGGK
ncbi:MAG: hypothetical protein ABSG63_02870 [Spirochaetia bacterium]|jgi:hypothetical protein